MKTNSLQNLEIQDGKWVSKTENNSRFDFAISFKLFHSN